MLKYHTPGADTPSPRADTTPPEQTPPHEQTPPWEQTPPEIRPLLRTVRILLECILVLLNEIICFENKNLDRNNVVDPVILNVEENTTAVLSFADPGSVGSYDEITWYKNQTGGSKYRIVYVHPSTTGGEPKYNNEYCSGTSPCDTSAKGQLNVDSGEMTIYSVIIRDELFYYYSFHTRGDVKANTGKKYEFRIKVHGKYIKCVKFPHR